MRHYPPDSRQAQARIVAAALLADGSLDSAEIEHLDNGLLERKLGIPAGEFDSIVADFYHDLNQTAVHHNGGQLRLSRETTRQLLGDIRNPALQLRLLALLLELIGNGDPLSRDERYLLSEAMQLWGKSLAAAE